MPTTHTPEVFTDPADSAFPIPDVAIDYTPGLTKREYFAAMALQGLLATGKYLWPPVDAAVEAADQMLEALNRPKANKKSHAA